MQIINGKEIAAGILAELKLLPKPEKFFAGIVIGDDPSSESFQKLKQRTTMELGVDYRIYHLSPELGNDGLRKEIGRIGAQKTCGGVIIQFPIPEHLNKHYLVNAIPAGKDPDVLSERSLGAFYANRNPVLHPAAATVEAILAYLHFDLKGKKVAVVGPGFLIGKPIATWLVGRTTNLYVLDRGADFSILKTCDLVISGAGQIGLLTPEMLKDDAGVIDFSYSKNERGELVGDFDPSSLNGEDSKMNSDRTASGAASGQSSILRSRLRRFTFNARHSASPQAARNSWRVGLKTGFYTPTPGGTGPILVAKLLENFYKLNSEKKMVPSEGIGPPSRT